MPTGHPARKFLRSALPGLLFAAPFLLTAHASPGDPKAPLVDIATAPLATATTVLVKPNVLFLLDDSSSMGYNYLPDEVPKDIVLLGNPFPQTDSHAVALTSSQCNGVAYNPAIFYKPPVDSNNNAMADSVIDAAPNDGFSPPLLVTKTDLTGQFYYYYDPNQAGALPAMSYTYLNSMVNTTTDFYKECNSPTTNAPKFAKVNVSSLSPANKTNYANWYTYYRTRLLMMKTLAGQSFAPLTKNFRIGFSTVHDTGVDDTATFLPIADFDTIPAGTSQKEKFFTKLYGIGADAAAVPPQFTPLRAALSKAGRMYAGELFTGTRPGATPAAQARDPMQYSCQQNFTLLASDGYWNSPNDTTSYGPFQLGNEFPVGDQDGTAARPMFDFFGRPNTLADVAMYYYETDLRKTPGTCKSGSTGEELCPAIPNVPGNDEDNNPKPHMTTLTVGLAVNGLLGYSPSYKRDKSGDFDMITKGQKDWPDPLTSTDPLKFYDGSPLNNQIIERVDDLWHAAVNGRGTYFNANNPTTLANGMKAALGAVASRLGYGNAGATSSLAPITGDNALYVASYVTGQWTGNLVAQSINVDTGEVERTLAWCVENFAGDPLTVPATLACSGTLGDKFPDQSHDTRQIYFNQGTATLGDFKYPNLSATQQAYFNNNKLSQWINAAPWTTVATGDTLVDYLRGQSRYEYPPPPPAVPTDPLLYRQRKAILGDIVDNQPVFVGKPYFQYTDPGYAAFKTAQSGRLKTLYVGANDGMLHAIDAGTGVERWAFVPTTVMPNMYWLADLGYTANHHNYVNGRITFSDVCTANCTLSTATWKTILMGALNGGGRGIYALDVTDPDSPKMLWEFTSLDDADFGYSFGNPLAVKNADGKWVVLVSSGYDNVKLNIAGDPYDADGSGKGFLFVLEPLGVGGGVATAKVIDKITTGVGAKSGGVGVPATPSGLGKMSYWSDSPEQNATALFAYGGDLLGNLWRFDINTKAVVQLAEFKDKDNNLQPITTRPEMTNVGTNRMIFVATGKYLEASDLDSTKFKTQSLYAILDKGTKVADPRGLAERILSKTRPRTVSKVDSKDPALGWFVDFPDPGERSNVDMVLAVGTLLVPTNVPTNQICDAGGYSWLNYLDYATGEKVTGASSAAIFMNGNDMTTGINVVWINGRPQVIRTGNASAPALVHGVTFEGAKAGVRGHRVGWREIFTK